MLTLVSLHSIGFIAYYLGTHQHDKITSWATRGNGCAILAGLVAWISGLIIWITSLSLFRRRCYEFFFGAHHLYIVFALFWLYHVVWTYRYFVIPLLFFFVDRLLRMFQSKQLVDVLSARVLESGAVELKLARNNQDGFVFHALTTWCIQIPSISKLQWHFFSATSTPGQGDRELSIVIKPLGAWTRKLHNQVKSSIESMRGSSSCPFSFKARVEGPYGDESDFYLKYETLVLVSGGIGVTPILAILQDILHRHKRADGQFMHLPTSIEVYHLVRTTEELCVLNNIDPNHIFPNYEKLGLNIRVHAYVTSKQIDATLANKGESNAALDLTEWDGANWNSTIRTISPTAYTKPQGISSFAAIGDTKWIASITILSILGYFVLSGLSYLYIVKTTNGPFPNYSRAHMVVGCMLLGILLFGGGVLMIWSYYTKRLTQAKESYLDQTKGNNSRNSSPNVYLGQLELYDQEANVDSTRRSPWNGDLHLSCRPNWEEIFDDLSNKYKGQNVGVLVSGTQNMQEDVARQCHRHSTFLLPIDATTVAFDYHSVSFQF
ncbi:hypothetical protein GOP47_0014690 [Adiantum capillus-veneris]|uniref:FAD-binding FR-type domain-containing protein n=1 Tax=Adiantum capillus-veneris TaxID=13818 RepID=A0A9D4UMT8_ADICA|nr:hypothetical protein GOP47_0014690 [Adiantum capillus-veneris]